MSSSGVIRPNGRKRVLSRTDDTDDSQRKRPRVSSISAEFQAHLQGESPSRNNNLERLPKPRPLHDDEFDSFIHPLSHSRSFTGSSKTATPSLESGPMPHAGMALMRSVSAASLRSTSPAAPVYPDISAKHFLRNTKITIDFSAPSANSTGTLPFGLSPQNMLLFNRGNRIHYKNISTNEDIGQLCKLQDCRGDLRVIECGGVDQPGIVALGTSKGFVQIWDLPSKKVTASWSTKGITSMRFNGPVLTIGGPKGTIRQYDTRIKEAPKIKEQVRKVTRHQTRISSLSWNVDGRFLASGDENGTVYCWDSRQAVPLDVGEFVQRRKKMQHPGAITALAWSPWQPKLLASGDSSACGAGTIQLWNIDTSSYSDAAIPGKLELNAQITSLHFSPHCKEFMSTHGPGLPSVDGNSQSWPRAVNMANSVTVHSCPSLRHVVTLPVTSAGGIGGGALSASGMKAVLVVPAESKLKLWDVWGKKKEIRRQPSFLDRSSIR